jgi:hypothetical protein
VRFTAQKHAANQVGKRDVVRTWGRRARRPKANLVTPWPVRYASEAVTNTITIRRALLSAAALAVVWALVIAVTGGFYLQLGPIRFSSRRPLNPLLMAVAAAVGWLLLLRPAGFRGALRQDWEWSQPVIRVLRLIPVHRVVLAFAAWGIAIDVYQWLGMNPLWLDEEMIGLNLRDRSFAELASPLWLEQSAPYGWMVLQRALLLAFGDGELVLRFVPLVFGAATVMGAVWVARRWMGAASMVGLVLLCWISRWLAHYRFEVKHYSADTFFALLLPALVVWALEGDATRTRLRRAVIWWAVAAAAQWLANGALLVTPGCAVVLVIGIWHRDGWRAAGLAAAAGVIWFAAFAGHYAVTLRYTGHLRDYWSDQFPPKPSGITTTVRWLAGRVPTLANIPGGTALWLSLWSLAAFGFAFGTTRLLGVAFATVPASAFLYVVLGLVPLYDRFSIWIVPALYVGVMLLVDRAVRLARLAWTRAQWGGLVLALAIVAATFRLGSDIVARGRARLDIPHSNEKQQLNDRAAVHWLMEQRQSGDIVMTTRLGWPAVWWYGRISIADDAARDPIPKSSSAYEMMYVPPGPDCRPQPLAAASTAGRRLLVYYGFRDVPSGFDELLERSLNDVGVVTDYGEYAVLGRVFVVDLTAPVSPTAVLDRGRQGSVGPRLDGCVGIKPAQKW